MPTEFSYWLNGRAGAVTLPSPSAAADTERIAWLEAGDHARVIATMPQFLKYHPEARFAHYLMMVAALGEGSVTAQGRAYSAYENSVGTGQMHLWFDRPLAGWSS